MSPELTYPSPDDYYLERLPASEPLAPSGNPLLDEWAEKQSYAANEPKYREFIEGMAAYRQRIEKLKKWYGYSGYNYDVYGSGNVSILTDQARAHTYEDRNERWSKIYSDDEIKELAVDLANIKKQETDWAVLFGSPETPPAEIVASLGSFWEWLGQADRWYANDSDHVGTHMFVSPSSLRTLMLDAVLRAIEAEPELEEAAVAAFGELKGRIDAAPKKEALIYKVMLKTLPDILYDASQANEAADDYDRQMANLHFLSRLTDEGLIKDGEWYKFGVRGGGKLPSFEFLDALRARLVEHGGELAHRKDYASYYLNASSFAKRVLARMTTQPGRNNSYAQALVVKLDQLKREGTNSPTDYVTLANIVTPVINHLSAEDPLSKLPASVESLPQAFMRLLYTTRDPGATEDVQAAQQYEDEVYGDILSYVVSKASQKHEDWFIRNVLSGQNEARVMLSAGYQGTYRTGVHRWRKGARSRISHRR